MLDQVSFDRGIHLRGSPLWIDPERKRELALVLGLRRRLPSPHDRIVASAPMSQALGRTKFSKAVLPAPWERWIGVGGQRAHLIDAGAPPGAAYALLTSGRSRILFCGALRHRLVTLPRADLLVSALPAALHRGGNHQQLLTAARLFVEQSSADRLQSTLLFDSLEVGLWTAEQLTSSGYAVRPLGLLAKLLPLAAAPGAQVTLSMVGRRIPTNKRVMLIDSGEGASYIDRAQLHVEATVRTRWYADVEALAAAVEQCQPRAVALCEVPVDARDQVTRRLGSIPVRFLGGPRQLRLGQAD